MIEFGRALYFCLEKLLNAFECLSHYSRALFFLTTLVLSLLREKDSVNF